MIDTVQTTTFSSVCVESPEICSKLLNFSEKDFILEDQLHQLLVRAIC